LHLLDN